MFASAAFIALAMAQLGPPIVIPQQQLHVTWNQSPNGPGGSLMGYQPERVGTLYRDSSGILREPPLFDEWTGIHGQTEDHLLLSNNAGRPALILNTRSGVIGTGIGQGPGAPSVPGFVLTASSATPFLLEFTCQDPRVSGGWQRDPATNAHSPLVIRITP